MQVLLALLLCSYSDRLHYFQLQASHWLCGPNTIDPVCVANHTCERHSVLRWCRSKTETCEFIPKISALSETHHLICLCDAYFWPATINRPKFQRVRTPSWRTRLSLADASLEVANATLASGTATKPLDICASISFEILGFSPQKHKQLFGNQDQKGRPTVLCFLSCISMSTRRMSRECKQFQGSS